MSDWAWPGAWSAIEGTDPKDNLKELLIGFWLGHNILILLQAVLSLVRNIVGKQEREEVKR